MAGLETFYSFTLEVENFLSGKTNSLASNFPMTYITWYIKWSREWWRHLTLKGHGHEPNTLKAQYLKTAVDAI